MTMMASQITSLMVVYSTVYSHADQRKYQSSASLAFVSGIHRDRWVPCTKGQLRGKCFHWWHYHDTTTCTYFTDILHIANLKPGEFYFSQQSLKDDNVAKGIFRLMYVLPSIRVMLLKSIAFTIDLFINPFSLGRCGKHFKIICPRLNARELQWLEVTIGSCYGLVHSDPNMIEWCLQSVTMST